MMNLDDNRVLCRKGARDLSKEEVDNIGGGAPVTTRFCTLVPHKDGDDD